MRGWVRFQCPEGIKLRSIPGGRATAGLVLASVAAFLAGCDAPSEPLRAAHARVGYDIDDDVISRNVRAALKAESEFPLHVIRVSTSGGEVVLSGVLASDAQVDRSLAIALLVGGVQRVENRLRTAVPDAEARSAGRNVPEAGPKPAARF